MANNEYDSSLSLRLQMKNAREQGVHFFLTQILTCMRKIRYSQTQNSRLSKAKSPDSKGHVYSCKKDEKMYKWNSATWLSFF